LAALSFDAQNPAAPREAIDIDPAARQICRKVDTARRLHPYGIGELYRDAFASFAKADDVSNASI
jgi:hypothetical protein